jgi:hypothetical protein
MFKTYSKQSAGHYLGTEIDEKWWRRYRKDGLFARGNGKYRISDDCFYFRRYLTKTEIAIPLKELIDIKTANWHAGRYAGGSLIIKLIWNKDGIRLSSGFVVSKNRDETKRIIETLKELSCKLNSSFIK